MRKILPICVIGVLLLSGFGAVALNSDVKELDFQTIDFENAGGGSRDYTHTVLAEQATATWCPHCPAVSGYMETLYESGDYDFYYVSMVCDSDPVLCPFARQRMLGELGVTGYPTVVFDGGYTRVIGNVGSTGPYITALNSCGSRAVADVDLGMTVSWLGNAEMEIEIDITNHESSTYAGHLHTYVTEINSRWSVLGHQYHFAMIGDPAFDKNVNVPGGDTSHQTTTWDGNDYGFGDITEDNIMVIATVFDSSSDYVDETTAAIPGGGGEAPNEPSTPDGPDEGIVDEEYTFFTSTEDPQEDDVYYLFDWDDGTDSGWLGPYPSGSEQSASHSWDKEGEYDVRVKAKDENGAVSDWSFDHTIEIFERSDVDIIDINGGLFRVSSTIRNPGVEAAEDVSWTITLDGGLILLGKETTGTGLSIPAGGEETVNSKLILGFGKTRVIVTAEIPDGGSDSKNQGATVLLFFIKVNPGG